MRCLHLVRQLGGNFLEADLGGGSRSEATVGIQGDAGGGKVLEGRFDAGDNFIGRINLAGITANAAKAYLKILAQILEYGHVARAWGGEFHGEMIHFQAVELAEDGSIAPPVGGLATGACAGASAEVDGKLDVIEAINDLVDHVDTEVRSVVIFCADLWVNKQAKVRIINLDHGNAFLAQKFNFATKDGDAVGNE